MSKFKGNLGVAFIMIEKPELATLLINNLKEIKFEMNKIAPGRY